MNNIYKKYDLSDAVINLVNDASVLCKKIT